MKKYDFLVVGTGAANIVTDAAIDAGKSVAIIEKGRFGGTCLNRGCIPTKTLITPIDYKKDFERLKDIGVAEGEFEINWQKLKERMWNHIDSHSQEVLEAYQAEENVDIYQGKGFFVAEKVLRVEYKDGSLSEELTADIILLAHGARTRIPDTKGLSEIDYITSENFFGDHFPDKPFQSLAILGGGVIASEFAHLFANLGTKVTIIQHNPRLLPNFDKDIVDVLIKEYQRQNVDIYLHTEMLEIANKDGRIEMRIENLDNGEQKTVTADRIMLAIGLSSNSDLLQIENAGVKTDRRGWIRTNEYLETSVPGVFSIGDANGRFQLRHVANYEAEILAFNLFERFQNNAGDQPTPRRRVRYDTVPAAVFSEPQIASVGLNTKMAEEQGFEVVYGRYEYGQTSKPFAMGYAFGDQSNFVKVLADRRTETLLGAQIVGPEASVLVQIYTNLMNSGKHEYQIIDEEIASEETKREREQLKATYLNPRNPAALNYTMTIHPALSEVATWAASELDFGHATRNAELEPDADC